METRESQVFVEVLLRVPDAQGELQTVLHTSGKLTKADATRSSREHVYVYIRPGEQGDYSKAVVSMSYTGDFLENTAP